MSVHSACARVSHIVSSRASKTSLLPEALDGEVQESDGEQDEYDEAQPVSR